MCVPCVFILIFCFAKQIFDYWWDTTGFMIEHYADGDLVNEETPVGYLTAADEALAVWGPDGKGFNVSTGCTNSNPGQFQRSSLTEVYPVPS